MKHFFTLLIFTISFSFLGNAQTVIYDWESAATSVDMGYFGTSTGTATVAIANPDMSGVNTSATVMELEKYADGVVWQGAAADTPVPMDFLTGGNICLKMWADQQFDLLLKLEQSSNGGADWENVQTHPGDGTWMELCWDSAVPSSAGGNLASGFIYNRLALFPGFGTEGTVQAGIVYIDDVIVDSTPDLTEYNANFTVDMSNETGFTGVFLRGSFNNWSEDNPMTDNGDGTWSTTIPLMNGTYEYKYAIESDGFEEFSPLDGCVTTNGGYTNRVFNIGGEDFTTASCFNSCYACGESVSITWLLNMSEQAVDANGVYLAGGEFFGHGDFPMTDDDGDGVYAITLERGLGFTSDFTFLNGICLPNWECKEDIAGQDCAVDPYNDRRIEDVQADLVYATCFGVCSTTTDCAVVPGIEYFSFGSVEVYPTLVSDAVNVNFLSDRITTATYNLVNLQGSTVQFGNITEGKNIIEASDLSSGLYIIQFMSEGTQFHQTKIIVE